MILESKISGRSSGLKPEEVFDNTRGVGIVKSGSTVGASVIDSRSIVVEVEDVELTVLTAYDVVIAVVVEALDKECLVRTLVCLDDEAVEMVETARALSAGRRPEKPVPKSVVAIQGLSENDAAFDLVSDPVSVSVARSNGQGKKGY